MRIKLFGLRLSRIKEFHEVMKLEAANTSKWDVAKKVLLGVWVLLTSDSLPTKREIRRRYKTCLGCAISKRRYNEAGRDFDGLPQCRNGIAGCGCYIPYKVLQEDECWGWFHGIGWRRADKSDPAPNKDC